LTKRKKKKKNNPQSQVYTLDISYQVLSLECKTLLHLFSFFQLFVIVTSEKKLFNVV